MKKIKEYFTKDKIRATLIDVFSDVIIVALGIAVGYYIKTFLIGF